MDKFLETLDKIWANQTVRFVVYTVVAFLVAWLASFLVKRLFKLFRLDEKFDRWGINEGEGGTAVSLIGKLTFLIVFLLFLSPALDALGLESVSKPLIEFTNVFIGYLPNIIAALLLFFLGVFLGKILSKVVTLLLSKTKIDNLGKKFSKAETTPRLSVVTGKVINALIVLIATAQALAILNIKAISEPAISIIEAVFGAVPNIILAAIVIAIGLGVAGIVCGFLKNLLDGLGFDSMVARMLPSGTSKFSVTALVINIIRGLIILFIIAQGIEILGLSLLGDIMNAVISYLPMIVKAAVIALVAFFGAGLLESAMQKAFPEATLAAKIVKVIIYVIAGFMILSQLDFATTIVNYAFIITMVALAIAFALAFGLGGRDFAKNTLARVNIAKKSGDEDEKNITEKSE